MSAIAQKGVRGVRLDRSAEETTALQLVEEWFKRKCDGNWEHQFGVTLESTDDPGWAVTLDMDMTPVDLDAVPGWREGAGSKVGVRMFDGKVRIWADSVFSCLNAAALLIIHEFRGVGACQVPAGSARADRGRGTDGVRVFGLGQRAAHSAEGDGSGEAEVAELKRASGK